MIFSAVVLALVCVNSLGVALKRTACFPFITSVFFSMFLLFVIFFRCLVSVYGLSFVSFLRFMLRCHLPSDNALKIVHCALYSFSVLLIPLFCLWVLVFCHLFL